MLGLGLIYSHENSESCFNFVARIGKNKTKKLHTSDIMIHGIAPIPREKPITKA